MILLGAIRSAVSPTLISGEKGRFQGRTFANKRWTTGYSAVQPLPGGERAGVVLEAQLPPSYELRILFASVKATDTAIVSKTDDRHDRAALRTRVHRNAATTISARDFGATGDGRTDVR